MIHLPLLAVALGLAATVFVSSTHSASMARRRAIPWALLALLGTFAGALFGVVPDGEAGVVAAFTPLSAALAATLATLVLALVVGTPSDRIEAPFFARLLATGSVGTAFLLLREPLLLALLWPLTAAPLLAEVGTDGAARREALEHVALSAGLVLAGTILVSIYALLAVAAELVLADVLVREGTRRPTASWSTHTAARRWPSRSRSSSCSSSAPRSARSVSRSRSWKRAAASHPRSRVPPSPWASSRWCCPQASSSCTPRVPIGPSKRRSSRSARSSRARSSRSPLARISAPAETDPGARVTWSEGTAMTARSLATVLLALQADGFATWIETAAR